MDTTLQSVLKELRIAPVHSLFPHEQIIPPHLKKLKEAMLNMGYLVDPLVIDKKSRVVLDGNHRYRVLKDISCPNAVVQFVDYSSDNITVGTWFPATSAPISRLVKLSGEKPERVDFEEGLSSLNKKTSTFMAVSMRGRKKTCVLFNSIAGKNLDEIIENQNALLKKWRGVRFVYMADFCAEELLRKGYTVIYRKAYTKQEIVERAKSGRLFPPKSTRHVIPNRIIRLNMKLGWLQESRKEAFRLMKNMLAKRVYEGNIRHYTEPVIVIY